MARYKALYRDEIRPSLKEKLGYKNIYQVPKVEKITINMGVGEAAHDYKLLETAIEELKFISGQTPRISRAKKSIANFNIREGQPIGCFVTLRNNRMLDFLDRMINMAIPRMKDFRGLPKKSFDGRGN